MVGRAGAGLPRGRSLDRSGRHADGDVGDDQHAARPAGPATGATAAPYARLSTIALAIVAVLVLTGVAFTIGLMNDEDDPTASSPSDSPSSSDASTPPDEGPTEAAMEGFIEEYLDLVVSDPEAAFARLSADFQAASGGLSGYLDFWGAVTSTKLESISADPESMVVEYTYTRHERGGGKPVSDDVSLQLEDDGDGGLLIAGEA